VRDRVDLLILLVEAQLAGGWDDAGGVRLLNWRLLFCEQGLPSSRGRTLRVAVGRGQECGGGVFVRVV
jgi:hypothetical protein